MQDSEHLHLAFVHFVNGNKWKGRQHKFARAMDAAKPSAVWKSVQRVNAPHYVQCNSQGGFRAIRRNVIGDPLKILRGVAAPPDAHHVR